MAYYIKRTTKFYGAEPFTVVVNDYSTKEIAEKALAHFRSQKPLWQRHRISILLYSRNGLKRPSAGDGLPALMMADQKGR